MGGRKVSKSQEGGLIQPPASGQSWEWKEVIGRGPTLQILSLGVVWWVNEEKISKNFLGSLQQRLKAKWQFSEGVR